VSRGKNIYRPSSYEGVVGGSSDDDGISGNQQINIDDCDFSDWSSSSSIQNSIAPEQSIVSDFVMHIFGNTPFSDILIHFILLMAATIALVESTFTTFFQIKKFFNITTIFLFKMVKTISICIVAILSLFGGLFVIGYFLHTKNILMISGQDNFSISF
jgi:hypothetical protein